MVVFYLALQTIALGTGGLKWSIAGFRTDQFDEKDDKEKAHMAFFFNPSSSSSAPALYLLSQCWSMYRITDEAFYAVVKTHKRRSNKISNSELTMTKI